MSLIDSTLEHNLFDLELMDYEEDDLVVDVVDDLKLYFQSFEYKCNKTAKKVKDPRNRFEKIGFKNFFERYFEFKSLNKKEKDISIKIQLMTFQFENENSLIRYKYQYNVYLINTDYFTCNNKNGVCTFSCKLF